ncbi:DUF808 family protein [Vreelandella alkaliphila]
MAIGGLIGLLDDIAALAKFTAASLDDVSAAAGRATAKAAGVVVDDTAVTPQYLQGVTAERELAIVKQIALGSIRNKLIFILPVALLLNYFLPALLPRQPVLWSFNTLCSAVMGLLVGSVVVGVLHLVPNKKAHAE